MKKGKTDQVGEAQVETYFGNSQKVAGIREAQPNNPQQGEGKMKKEEAALVARGLTKPAAEAIKVLGKNGGVTEEELKTKFKRWGHVRNALTRRNLIKVTKKGVASLNADGRKVLQAL